MHRGSIQIVGSLLAFVLAGTAIGSAEGRGPSTAEERARVLGLVDLLESTPQGAEADEARQWLTLWLIEIPDLTVSVCLAPLGPTRELENVLTELKVQPTFSQAAFQIRHPEAGSRSLETYIAGVEGTIRAYDAMRAAGAVQELEPFEELKREQASGTLRKVIKKRMKRCK